MELATMAALAGGVGKLAGAFGRKKNKPQQQQSGFAAMPPELQSKFLSYIRQIGNVGQEQGRYGQAPEANSRNPFASQALSEFQAANPDRNVRPLGVVEPFNRAQEQALGAFSNPDYSEAGLAKYFDPFHENVTKGVLNTINESFDKASSRNIGGLLSTNPNDPTRYNNSAIKGMNAQLEAERAKALDQAKSRLGSEGFQNALGLRNQSLMDMLKAGGTIQNQNQRVVNSALPENAMRYNPAFQNASSIAQLIGSMQSSSGTGAQEGGLNTMGKVGHGLNAAFGNQFADFIKG